MKVKVMSSFQERLTGAIIRDLEGYGLLFIGGGAIHTFFMRYNIDIYFIKGGCVEKACMNVEPWKIVTAPKKSEYVLELRSDGCEKFKLGQAITFNLF